MKLYDFDTSPYCQRVRIVLSEKGIPYEKIPTNIRTGEARTPEYLKLCPYGQVPVLTDGDTVLYESVIINEYLEDTHPTPPLRPSDPGRRARMRIWVDFFDNHLNPPYTAFRLENMKPEGQKDAALMEKKRGEILEQLEVIDRELAGKDYLLGEFTLADAAVAPRLFRLAGLKIEVPAKMGNLRRYMETLRARKSVKEALSL